MWQKYDTVGVLNSASGGHKDMQVSDVTQDSVLVAGEIPFYVLDRRFYLLTGSKMALSFPHPIYSLLKQDTMSYL